MSDIKPFNKDEKFVCEMLWGGVPVDVGWARETKMFQEGMKKFAEGYWKEVLTYIKPINNVNKLV